MAAVYPQMPAVSAEMAAVLLMAGFSVEMGDFGGVYDFASTDILRNTAEVLLMSSIPPKAADFAEVMIFTNPVYFWKM